MEALNNIEAYTDRYRLIHIFLMVYLFFLPFSRFAGIRNTAFVLLFLLLLIRVFNGGLRLDIKDRTVQALFLLCGISLLSSVLSPYPLDSLDAVRKYLLYQVVVFFVIINEYRGIKELKPLVYALFAGFGALTLIVYLKNEPAVLINWIEYAERFTPEEMKATFFSGYSLYATFYMPLLLGYIYASRDKPGLKALLWVFLFLEFVLVFLHNHRTQLLSVLFSSVVITLVAGRYRIFAAASAVLLIAALVILNVKPEAFDRYKTLLSMDTYTQSGFTGWNSRFEIWSGAIDMIKDRPVLGYGYGWKKTALVARDGGYIQKWKTEKPRTYEYYNSTTYGSTNPHNLVLQILFEVGILGLLAFLFFWSTVLSKALFTRLPQDDEAACFLRYGTIGVLISYIIINISNGLWEEAYGVLMMALAAMTIVLHREALKSVEEAGRG